MPLRLRIIGNLFRLCGWVALAGLVVDLLTRSTLTISFGWLLIFVGSGLLKGKRSSRRWASLWVAYWIAQGVALIVLGVMRPAELSAHLFTRTFTGPAVLPYVLVLVPIWLAAMGWMLWLLWSPSVSECIERWEAYRRFVTDQNVKALELRRSLTAAPSLGPPLATALPVPAAVPVPVATRGRVAALARLVQYGKVMSVEDVEQALRELEELRGSGKIDEASYHEYRDLLTRGRSSASA